MTSSTILRVKRRLEDNPQDAFVLTCKRLKTDIELAPSLFVFRGTVENQENIKIKDLVPKENLKIKSETSVNDIIRKIRKERKGVSAEQRYEIVNYSRGLDEARANEENYNLVDLEPKSKALEENDVKYAYDLYIAAKQDFDISMLDDLVSIENYETDLILGSYRDNGQRSPSSEDGSSDDSNDENNWRNDYPDTENSSIDEDDMIRAFERCDLEDDLSSDTGEDKIYEEDLINTLSTEDVQRYGVAYAKYKARVLTEGTDLTDSRNFVHCSKIKELDEESINGYKEDSDDGFYYGQDEDTEQFKKQYEEDKSSDEFVPD